MALSKTISANGAKGHHTFTLTVTESSTSGNNSYLSYTFQLSQAVTSAYKWAQWGDRISYSIGIAENTYTGSIPAYDGGTVTIKSGSNIEVAHNSDGTKTINISFSVTDNANQSYTCGNASASDTFALTDLHKAPVINSATMVETNTKLTNLSLPNTTIVQYLSKKTITLSVTTYDSASITNYSIYHNNVLIGTSSTNSISIDFANVGELMTTNSNYVELVITALDNKGGYSTKTFSYSTIKYTVPTVELSLTSIKRKTGGGVALIDNVAVLNFSGVCYKGNDLIGNSNTPLIQYKIYKRNVTEPNYSTTLVRQLDSNNLLQYETNKITNYTLSNNKAVINNFEINSVDFRNIYLYKIKISDEFNSDGDIKAGLIPLGVSVWSEYPDKVDFLEITTKDKYLSNIGDTIKAYKDTPQSVSSNTTAIVTLNTVEFNNSNKLTLSNNAIYIGKNVHTVLVNARWTSWGADSTGRYIYISKNDTNVAFNMRSYSATMETTAIIPVEEGDYIDMRVYHTQSSAISINNDIAQTFLEVTILN